MTMKSPIITALNTSTYVSITMTGGDFGKWSVAYYTEDGTSFKIATDSAGSDEAIVPADSSINQSITVKSGGVLFYAKAVAGTPNLVLLTAQ